MTTFEVLFAVPMAPHPKGRPRVRLQGKRPIAYTPKATMDWMAGFAEYVEALAPVPRLDEPVRVDILAILQRPKDLMRKMDPGGLIAAPRRPDADNIRKATLDAMHAFWVDDARVVAGDTVKTYSEKGGSARMVVRVCTLYEGYVAHRAKWMFDT